MKKKQKIPDGAKLRKAAEKRLKSSARDENGLSGMSSDYMENLVHELRVNQIELEMQNEELRRIQNELEKTRDHYRRSMFVF
jgi:cation transport regulator ChaC